MPVDAAALRVNKALRAHPILSEGHKVHATCARGGAIEQVGHHQSEHRVGLRAERTLGPRDAVGGHPAAQARTARHVADQSADVRSCAWVESRRRSSTRRGHLKSRLTCAGTRPQLSPHTPSTEPTRCMPSANFVVIHVVSSSFSGSTVGTYDAEYCSGDHRAHVRTRVHTGVGASRSKIAIPLALPSMFNLLALML